MSKGLGVLLVSIFLMVLASAVNLKPAAADSGETISSISSDASGIQWGLQLNYQVREVKEYIDGNFTVYLDKQEILTDADGNTRTVKRTFWDNVTSETKLLWVPNRSHVRILPNPNCHPERIKAVHYSLNNCAGWKDAIPVLDKTGKIVGWEIEVTPEEANLFPGNIMTLHVLLELKDGDVKKRWLWVVPLGTSKKSSENNFLVQWKKYEARCPQTWGELMFYQTEMQNRWHFGGSPSDPDWVSTREMTIAAGAKSANEKQPDCCWLFGNGVPAADLGCNGQCYIDCDAGAIWQRVEGKWIFRCCIKGKDGAQGLQGLQGIQGIPGTPGTPGAPGTNGTDATADLFSNEGFVRLHFSGGDWPEWLGYEVWVDGISSWRVLTKRTIPSVRSQDRFLPKGNAAYPRTEDLLWMYHIGDPQVVKPNRVVIRWIDLDCGNVVETMQFEFTHIRCKPVSHYIIPIGDWQSYAKPLPKDKAQQDVIFQQRKAPRVLTGVGPFSSEEYVNK